MKTRWVSKKIAMKKYRPMKTYISNIAYLNLKNHFIFNHFNAINIILPLFYKNLHFYITHNMF